MKIAIIGYGKMGKVIEKVANERGHEIVLKIDSNNTEQMTDGSLKQADVAIEFSRPESALENITACLKQSVPVAIGTTGWYDHFEEVKALCQENDCAMLPATNFSVGVNIFFELNRQLAKLIEQRPEYSAKIEETHHTEKLDSPSGTAITLAEDIIKEHGQYQEWKNQLTNQKAILDVISYREPKVPGTHTITYDSEIDSISIEHKAKNRAGFALGAVLAAEYIVDKTGVFTMKDVLNF
jgi:4-hydroxy-tetrahydrodipicolinate reductase